MVTSNIPENLLKENWREDHLNYKHDSMSFTWCPLCMAKLDGEKSNEKRNDLGINVSDKIKPTAVFGR